MLTGLSRDFAQDSSRFQFRSKARFLLNSTALIPVVGALAAVGLLATPGAAFAQSTDAEGGNGGGGGGAGGGSVIVDGGIGVAGGPGVAAGSGGGGGGGGTGVTGGNGGTGSGGTAGGVGNNVFNAPAGNGANATIAGNGGGGGAGASTRFLSGGSLSFFAGATTYISGGAGGAGLGSGSGGGGGAGATFVGNLQFNASISAGAARTGGAGGAGGNGGVSGNGGDGGDGGAGLTVVLGGINTIEAGALYTGGVGGAGGSGVVAGLGGVGGAGLNQTNGTLNNQGTLRGGVGGTGSVGGLGGIGFVGSGVTINNTGTIAGGLSGGGGVQALAMRLSGTNTVTNIGTLTGGVEIASGTTTFDIASDQALANVVSGAGALAKAGTGTLTLSGANTYSGLTTVAAGTLVIGSNTALGSTAAGTIVQNGAALVLSGERIVGEAITLNGTGVGGTGALRGLANVSTLTGAITLASDARIEADSVLDFRGVVSGVDRTATFGGAGNIVIQLGSLQLGSGSVIKEGAGILGLFNTNSFTGDTDVRGGQLQISGGSALSDTGRLTLGTGTSARVITNTETIGSLAGSGTIFLQNGGSLVVGDATDTVFSGVIQTANGSGSITKRGTGKLTLSGASTYTGLTTVSGGTLAVGSASGLGAATAGTVVQTGGTLGFESTITVGSLQISETIVLDGGTLRNIAGNTNISGPLTLLADSIIAADANSLTIFASGGVQGGGNDLIADASGGSINFTAGLLNIATLTKNGSGVVALSGSNTIAGNVTVNGGTLQGVNTNALSVANAVTLNGGAFDVFRSVIVGSVSGDTRLSVNGFGSPVTLTLGGNNSSTSFSGQLSGDGNLIKTGTGTFTLTGFNNFVGGITVNNGTLQVGNNLTTGTLGLGTATVLVEANGTLNFRRSNLYSVSNAITGAGTIVKSGAGTVILTNVAGFTGSTLVEDGQLTIQGDFGGAITVDGGILGGTGTIAGAVIVNNGGTVAAGNSPGTLTVGALSLNMGSLTTFELGEAGVAGGANNDLIRVTGALTLNGGSVDIVRGSGFSSGRYTLFEFGSLVGGLGNLFLNPLDGGFVGTLAVDGNTIVLNAAPPEDLIFWNGSTLAPTGAVVGGSGTWNLVNGNFTEDDGDFTGAWAGNGFNAVFAGTGGTVMIGADTTVAPSGLAFLVDGYTIEGGNAASRLELTGPTGVDTAAAVGATINAVISGTGSMTKTGTGTLTLRGVNTYTGSTTVLGGTLVNSGTITGSVTNNATLTSTGSLLGGLTNSAGAVANLAGTVNGQINNSGTVNVTGNLATTNNFNFINSDAGLLNVSGGNYTGANALINNSTALNGINVSSGRTLGAAIIVNGATSSILNAGTITTSNRIDNSGTLTTTGTINGGSTGLRGLAGSTTNASGTINGAVSNAGTFNVTGNLVNNSSITNTGTFNVTGATVTTLGLNNEASGTVNAAGAINGQLGNAGTFNVTGNLTGNNAFINSGTGLLNVSGGDYTGLTVVINNSTAANAVNISAGRTLSAGIVSNGATSSILNAGTLTASNRIDNSGTLTTTGTINVGSFGLRGLAGSTTNASGTITGSISNAGTFNVTGNLVNDGFITNNGVFNLTGATLTSGGLSNNAGAVVNARGTLNGGVNNAGTFNVTGNLTNTNPNASYFGFDAGVLNVSDGDYTGLVVVSNSSTATNGVNISAGRTLSAQIVSNGANSSFLNAGTITTSNRLENNGSLTSTGTINGVFFNNAGATASLQGAVNGAFTNSGTVTVTGGLTVNGAVTQNSAGTFNLGGFTTSFGSLAGSGTVNLGAGTLTVGGNGTSTSFDGAINGTGGLVKTGAGTFTLAGTNGYTGQTRIDEGTLALAASGVIAGQVRNSGTFNNSGTVNGSVVNLATLTSSGTIGGGLSQFSGATGTVSGTLNGFVNNAGTLTVNGNLASNDFGQITGTGQVTVQSGARWSGLLGFTNLSTNAAGLSIAGTLDVNGIFVTQAGATTVIASGGTLTAQNSTNLGTVTNNGTVNTDVTNGSGNVAGTITNNGTWNGTMSQGLGSVTNTGRWNGNFLLDVGAQITNSGTWDTTSLFGGAVRDGTFINTGNLIGLGFAVTGANALLDNNITGVITLNFGQAFNIDTGGRINNFGTASATANVNAGGILRNFAGASWNGPVIIAATGSVGNSGTINGNVANSGTFSSIGTVNGNFSSGVNTLTTLAGALNGNISNMGRIELVGTTTGINILFQTASGTFDLGGFDTTIGGVQGSGQVLLGDGDLTVNAASNTGFSGVISGNGGLIKTGSQTLTLLGANTYAGGTSLSGGVLTVANNLALGTGQVTMLSGTTLRSGAANIALANAIDISGTGTIDIGTNQRFTLAGVISGGTLNQTGAGGSLLTLSGTNTYTGGTVLNGAFTLVSRDANLGAASGAVTFNGGATLIFNNTAAFGSTRNFIGNTNINLQTLGTAPVTLGGVVSGVGGLLKQGAGTLILTNANTYQGGTGLFEGVLTVANNRALGTGQVTMLGGTTLRSGAANIALANNIDISGTSTIDSAANMFTLSGVIGGSGSLIKIGGGTLTLTGVNTYTGTTFVDAGTLVVGEGGVVAPPPAATVAPAPTLVAVTAQAIEPAIASAPAQVGRGLLVGGTGSLTGGRTSVSLEPAATLAVVETAPVIAAVAGEAPVAPMANVAAQNTMLALAVIAGNVVNSATLINNGTILGMVINNAGASASNHGVIEGAVRNDGTLVSTGTLGGGLVNNGQAQIAGVLDGDVINTGTITLTGITTGIDFLEQAAGGVFNLAGFDTTLGAIMGAGSITLGAGRLTTGTDGVGTVFGGVISGTGSLAKVGTGRLVLTGANTYTGGTTISGGVLQLGNGGTSGSIVGPVVNNGALVINRSDAFTFASAISGTGMLVQDGSGTTTLTGTNSYSGGTLISSGRLVGNTASLQGQIQNNAALEFAQASAGIFAGQLFGAGLFDKTGLGLLDLTGNNNGFTGGTFVRGGELRVSGQLANSVVTVLSGSTLSGSGTIGGLIANSGSTIAPGANGAGVLGVNGAVNLQAGSTVQLQIRAGGPSDAIVSNGAATLGGTAAFSNLGGVYAFNSEIVLLQADGGRTGTFASTTGFGSFGILYRPELVYTANQARLRFAPNLLANIVGNTALTANQRSVVNRIDGAVTAGYNPQPLFNVYALPTAQLPGAFDQLSGEVYASTAGVGIEQERLVREAVLGRVNAVAMAARGDAAAGKGAGAWAQLFGGGGQGDSDGNAARIETDRTGFATGIDFGSANENGSWRAGVFGMQIQSDVTIDARGSSAEVEQSGGGVYASLSTGGFTATLGGYLTSVDLTASRTIALPGFAEVNNGETGGEARQAFAEVSFTIPSGKGMVRPFLGATIGSFDLDAFTETGGAAALTMRKQSYSTGTLTAGVDGMLPVGKSLTLFGTLAGRAQLGDRAPQAQLALAAAPQQAFGVAGAQFEEVAVAARLDASLKLGKNVDFSVGYTGLIGSTISDHGARATLQVQF